VHKNARTISRFVPRHLQSSSLFFGSHVVSGEAYGVVTNVGAQSKLAQFLLQSTTPAQRPLSQRISGQQRRIDTVTIILLGLLGIFSWVNGLSAATTVLLSGLLVTATMLLDWYIIALWVTARRVHVLGSQVVHTKQLAALETIGTSKTIVANLSASFLSADSKLTSFYVGKTEYATSQAPLHDKEAEPLDLFYTAVRLLQHTKPGKLFAPVIKLLPTLHFGTYHHVAKLPEHFEELSGGVWQSQAKKHTVLAATGTVSEVLDYCSDIWDHGHTRPLTQADRVRILNSAKDNTRVQAIAYSSDKNPKSLVLLGYGIIGSTQSKPASAAFRQLKHAHINLVFVSEHTAEETAQFLTNIHIPAREYTLVSGKDLAGVKPAPLAKVIQQTTLIIHDVSDEDLQLVAHASRLLGPVAINSDRLDSPELLAQSDVVIAKHGTAASEQAGATATHTSLDNIASIVNESRVATRHLADTFYTSLLVLAASLLLVWVMSAGLFFLDYTLLITPITLFFAAVIVALPLRISLGWHKQSNQLMRAKQDSLIKPLQQASHVAIIALTAAAAATTSGFVYLLLNNISIQYLATSSQVYAKTVTITAATFAVCLLVNVVIGWLQDAPVKQRNFLLGKSGAIATAFSLLLLYGFMYNPFMQDIFGTSAITPSDWLIVLAASSIFALVAVLTHYDHRHTRKNVAALHHTHKRSS
jgi:Ca2+-transporting ATPase